MLCGLSSRKFLELCCIIFYSKVFKLDNFTEEDCRFTGDDISFYIGQAIKKFLEENKH